MEFFIVNNNGETLLHFLSAQYPSLSKKKVKEQIERGFARVNDRQITLASYLLAKGERVTFDPLLALPTEAKIAILYEDERFLVIDKPPFVTSEETADQFGHVYLAHRLDKETSGCLLLAKDPITLATVEKEFRERKVVKEYRAIVYGEMQRGSGTIRARVGRIGSRGGQSLWGVFRNEEKEGGMRAETAYELLEARNGLSSVRLFPKTGRTHQLRVHLSHIGYPILGDKLYGSAIRQKEGPSRLLLHALHLQFLGHSVEAPLPSVFKEWFPQ